MSDDTSTGTTALQSEVRATAVNVKAQKRLSLPFVDEQLRRFGHHYGLNYREAGRMIMRDLEELDTDEALVNEFKRIYVGG